MWLKSNIIGAASGKTYGLKGTAVVVIQPGEEMWLVENAETKTRFYVWPEQLSNVEVEKEKIEVKIKKK
jgi:glyoxylate utilization-related uncharacterized protein